jgi:hypothetical protein
MPDIPEPPTDVHYINGQTGEDTLCDLQYDGADENGQHLWRVTNDISFEPWSGDKFKIAKMPAHTGISFPSGKITPGII